MGVVINSSKIFNDYENAVRILRVLTTMQNTLNKNRLPAVLKKRSLFAGQSVAGVFGAKISKAILKNSSFVKKDDKNSKVDDELAMDNMLFFENYKVQEEEGLLSVAKGKKRKT